MTYIREGMLPVWHVTDDGRRTRCGLAILDTDISLVTVADCVRRCVACQTVAAPGELDKAIEQVEMETAVDEFDKESNSGYSTLARQGSGGKIGRQQDRNTAQRQRDRLLHRRAAGSRRLDHR